MNKLICCVLGSVFVVACASRFEESRQAIYAKSNTELHSLNQKCAALTYSENDLIYDQLKGLLCNPDMDEQACERAIDSEHSHRMFEKYTAADWGWCAKYASTYPELFHDNRAMEIVVLHDHNQTVDTLCEQERLRIAKNTSQDINNVNVEQRHAIADAFEAISKGFGNAGRAQKESQGCCSDHNGVSYCNSYGKVMCNDGQQSPTCTCK